MGSLLLYQQLSSGADELKAKGASNGLRVVLLILNLVKRKDSLSDSTRLDRILGVCISNRFPFECCSFLVHTSHSKSRRGLEFSVFPGKFIQRRKQRMRKGIEMVTLSTQNHSSNKSVKSQDLQIKNKTNYILINVYFQINGIQFSEL